MSKRNIKQRLDQKLSLSPQQLIQANILQLNSIMLEARLYKELESNPALEIIESENNDPALNDEKTDLEQEDINRMQIVWFGSVSLIAAITGTVIAFASFLLKDRDAFTPREKKKARKLISSDDFIEIYCKASLETCEKRDVKGLYKRARAGEITNYTGIDSPYEVPENPDLIIDTDDQSLEESASTIFSFLESNGIIN